MTYGKQQVQSRYDKKYIYIAGQFANRLILKVLGEYIKKQIPSVVITSDWIELGMMSLKNSAETDYSCIRDSDLVLVTWPGGMGTSSEMGFAIGQNIPILTYIDKNFVPNIDDQHSHGINLLPMGAVPKENIITEFVNLIPKIRYELYERKHDVKVK